MRTASNLRQSGIFLTVELPDGTEVDIRRAVEDGEGVLMQHIVHTGLWEQFTRNIVEGWLAERLLDTDDLETVIANINVDRMVADAKAEPA